MNRCTISYCVTVYNRLEHLSQTLPRSVADNPACEFVVVDCGSTDGAQEWLRQAALPRLHLVMLTKGYYEPSKAKNCAHAAATGDVLVNLDADNIAAPEYTRELLELFGDGAELVYPNLRDRACRGGGEGRVAIARQLFERLGGYDEQLRGWGYDEMDLIRRAQAFGAECRMASTAACFLEHSHAVRTKNFACRDPRASNSRNQAISEANLRAGRLIANVSSGHDWAK